MPLKRWRWFRGHVRPIDILLPILALLGTGWLWWPLVFPPPPPPFAYGQAPFPVSPATLHPGDTPDVEVTRCNRTGKELTYAIARIVQRQPSGEQWYLPSIGGTAAPGCTTLHSQAHTLPADLPPGTYRLYFVATVPPTTDGGVPTLSTGRSADFDVVAGAGGEH